MEPYFYLESLKEDNQNIILDNTVSKHCIQVLRMKAEDKIRLTNGKGLYCLAKIIEPHKKNCLVQPLNYTRSTKPVTHFSIAIAFTKSNNRNEWLLEKLTEIGTKNIFPIITDHSEKQNFNFERYEKILVAAMLQSQQSFLPILHPTKKLETFIKELPTDTNSQYFIAHCSDSKKTSLTQAISKNKSSVLLIGPEGDFSSKEIELCQKNGFIPVHLGSHRLRTETAGIYACTVFNALQDSDDKTSLDND